MPVPDIARILKDGRTHYGYSLNLSRESPSRGAILIVEDERIVAMDLQQTLNEWGYDAWAIAASAEEALAHADRREPDLVLMDIRLKGSLDGVQTAELFKSRHRSAVIFLTANVDQGLLADAVRTMPYGYLMKPLRVEELRNNIDIALYRRRLDLERIAEQRKIERVRMEFVSTVSHELRTPLTSISASLGLLQSGAMGTFPERAAAMLAIASKNSDRLVRIVDDILDIGKLEAGGMELRLTQVSLSAVLRQSVEVNAGYAQKYGVQFVLTPAAGDDMVMADPERLLQVTTNLLSNAAKFSPPGSDVLIRVLPGRELCRVEVEDAGPGIPEDFQDRVFEKFAQADASAARRFEGTGLGLSIARGLIDAMHGRLDFRTLPARGTVFHFDLPTAQPPAAAAVALPG